VRIKVLNPVGIAVFSLLDGSRDVDALAAKVAEEFEIETIKRVPTSQSFWMTSSATGCSRSLHE
jgi:hypothetical protein